MSRRQANYWEIGRFGSWAYARLGYWIPCHQVGPRAGEDRGFGLSVRIGRWKKGIVVLPCH